MDTISFSSAESLSQIPTRFAAAWNRKDVDGVFADYADDADFVNVAGMWWHGKPRFVQEHADRFATVFAQSTLTFIDAKVRDVAAGVAIVHGIWTMTGHRKPDGTPGNDRSGILMFVVEKRAEGWKVVASQNTDIITQ
jgi:uncharacterized protein (TIGR02246 family)